MEPLDNPVWHALHGPHQLLAETRGPAARYRPDISLFGAFAEVPGHTEWVAMEELVGPDGVVILTGRTGDPPVGWAIDFDGVGVQMTGTHLASGTTDPTPLRPDVEVRPLGVADVDDMLALVGLTRPGPFAAGTWELGGYVGVRREGQLIAMAGQRLHPHSWCEISAVATHPDYRRQGLAAHLVQVVASGIVRRGETPFLHTALDNVNALRLYEAMGFTRRTEVRFLAARAPGDPDRAELASGASG